MHAHGLKVVRVYCCVVCFLWLGRALSEEWISDVFGVDTFSKIAIDLVSATPQCDQKMQEEDLRL